MFFSSSANAQIIPLTDSAQCFVAGDGAIFLDNGGDANYANCACFTTTTLCSPDGNPITINFLEFSVFATFDYVKLYNGTDNSGPLLYGNATGDPGAGNITLADMISTVGTTSFTASSGCITFDFYATAVVDYEGWKAEISTTSSHPGDNLACGTNLSCLQPSNIVIDEIGGTYAKISWNKSDSSGTYEVKFDTAGFSPVNAANTITTTSDMATLEPLQEDTEYEFFIRLVCDNGDSSALLGPYLFKTPRLNDVGVFNIINPNQDSCVFTTNETITVQIKNYGRLPQTFFHTRYAVNGIIQPTPFSDGLYTNVVGYDSTDLLTFETPYNFSKPGNYLIQAWTELPTDVYTENDTFSFVLNTAFDSLPIMEDFESGIFPSDWSHSEGTFANIVYAPNAHNNQTYVISDNLYSGDRTFILNSKLIGPLRGNDTLSFDYRYVNWSAGTIATNLSAADSLKIQVSSDCGNTYENVFVVDATNHTSTTAMTTIVVDLSAYKDLPVYIRFSAVWGAGDYWLDLDNINLSGCPINFALQGQVTDESGSGNADGSILVDAGAGVPPFTYIWNDTLTTSENLLDNLSAGSYNVLVVDSKGCTDNESFNISTLVGTTELKQVVSDMMLYPNPAQNTTTLHVRFVQPASAVIEVYNAFGQCVLTEKLPQSAELNHPLNLQNLATGIYFVRLTANGAQMLKKLIVQ